MLQKIPLDSAAAFSWNLVPVPGGMSDEDRERTEYRDRTTGQAIAPRGDSTKRRHDNSFSPVPQGCLLEHYGGMEASVVVLRVANDKLRHIGSIFGAAEPHNISFCLCTLGPKASAALLARCFDLSELLDRQLSSHRPTWKPERVTDVPSVQEDRERASRCA